MYNYDILKSFLDKKGMTIYQLAVATKISTSTFSAWRRGLYCPKEDKIRKIAEYLNISLDYLAGRTDDPSPIKTNISCNSSELPFFNEIMNFYNEMDENKRKTIYTISANINEMDERDIEFINAFLKAYQEKRKNFNNK